MAEKALRISVKSDLNEGKKLQKFLTDLIGTGNKLAKTLSGVTIGGGAGLAGQRGGLAKALLDDKKAMEQLGREGEKLARIYRDQVNREVQNLTRNIGVSEQHIKRLVAAERDATQELDRMRRAGFGSAALSKQERAVQGYRDSIAGYDMRRRSMEQGRQDLQQEDQPGGIKEMAKMLGGQLMRYVSWYAVASNIKDYALNGATQNVAWGQNLLSADARSANAMGTLGVRALRGDLMPGLGIQRLVAPGRMQDFQKVWENADQAQSEDAWRNVLTPETLLRMRSKLNEFGRDMSPEQRNAKSKEVLAGMIQEAVATDPRSNAMTEYMQSVAPGRVGQARKYGSMGAVFGIADAGRARNIDVDHAEGLVSSIVQQVGTKAGLRLRNLALDAIVSGMSDATAGGVARAMGQGGGNLMGRLWGSGMDHATRDAVGQAASALATGGGNRYSSSLAMPWFSSARDVRDVADLQAGIGALGAIGSGSLSPFQSTVNTAFANQNMGSGASVLGISKLAKMSPQQMLNALQGKSDSFQAGVGISGSIAKKQANDEISSQLLQVVQEKNIDLKRAPGIRMALEAAQSGDLGKYVRGLSGKNVDEQLHWMAGALGEATGQDDQSMYGMLRGLRGHMPGVGSARDAAAGTVSGRLNKARLNGETIFDSGETRDPNSPTARSALAVAEAFEGVAGMFERLSAVSVDAKEAGAGVSALAQAIERLAKSNAAGAAAKVNEVAAAIEAKRQGAEQAAAGARAKAAGEARADRRMGNRF